MTLNINDKVKVRLTARGRAILVADCVKVPGEDLRGWSEWQLWKLMKHFGPHLSAESEAPFEPKIKLDKDPL